MLIGQRGTSPLPSPGLLGQAPATVDGKAGARYGRNLWTVCGGGALGAAESCEAFDRLAVVIPVADGIGLSGPERTAAGGASAMRGVLMSTDALSMGTLGSNRH